MTGNRLLAETLSDASDDLVLRRATEDDSEYAFAMKKVVYRATIDKSGGWDEQRERNLHERNFPVFDYRVICLRQQPRGIISLDVSRDRLKINQIFIDPHHQGHGLGGRCMSMIIAEGRRLRVPVLVRVRKINPRAMAFYARLNFEVTEETEFHAVMVRQHRSDE